ncbi:MAG: hypothetical protein N2378_12635 [Chloroflexaceae bacterium]|nr:hypothetical protein [Chloroflexaceae bacterium]
MLRTVKRLLAGGVALTVVAGALAFPSAPASAQQRSQTNVPGQWGSAVLIQNVGTANLPANEYSIEFVNANGQTVQTFNPPSGTDIAPGASREFYIPRAVTSLAGGQYSAVVQSSQPVKVVVNSSTNEGTAPPWSAFAYEGLDTDVLGPRLFFPGFYKDYFGFRSELVIQNAGGGPANVRATVFSSQTGQQFGPFDLPTIAPKAALTISAADPLFASLPSGNNGLFGVVIESTNGVNLGGISNIWTTSDADAGVGSFTALTSGQPRVFAAALYNQYFGFVSSITIQNLSGTTAASGNIRFSSGTQVPFNVPPNQAREFYLPNIQGLASGNQNGLLSATIDAGASGNIVALVNIQRKARGSINVADPENPALGSYVATSTTAPRVRVPAIFNNYFGFFTSVTVQNVGTAPATLTLRYGDGRTWSTPSPIPAGGTFNFIHLPNNPANPFGSNRVQTGGTVESSPSQPLAVVVQHNTGRELPSFNSRFIPNDFLFALSGFPE